MSETKDTQPGLEIGDIVRVGGEWEQRLAEIRYINEDSPPGSVVRWTGMQNPFAPASYASVPLALCVKAPAMLPETAPSKRGSR